MSIRTLKGYLEGISVELLKSKFSHLAFARYLREDHDVVMCRLQPEGIPWLYFYRRNPGIGQMCVSLRDQGFIRGCKTTWS